MNVPDTSKTTNTTTDPADNQRRSEREKLPQEKRFDKLVYGGISYFGQATAGIALAYWMKYKGGRPIFDKAAAWTGEHIVSKLTSKSGQAAADASHTALSVTTMITVGNAFLVPVKWLENRKPQIIRDMVDKDNQKLASMGHPATEEKKAHEQQLLKQLEAQPNQTWTSLLEGRMVGLGAVYAVVFGMGDKQNKRNAKFIQDSAVKGLESFGYESLSQSKPLLGLIEMTFLDSFYSAISSGGLYIHSHFIHPPHNHFTNAAPAPEAITDSWAEKVQPVKLHNSAQHPTKSYEAFILANKEQQSDGQTLH